MSRIESVSIGLGCLGKGSIKLPKGVMFYCPQCGNECIGDKCRVSFCIAPESGLKQQVRLQVLCRSCGCFGESPSLESKEMGPMKIFDDENIYGIGG